MIQFVTPNCISLQQGWPKRRGNIPINFQGYPKSEQKYPKSCTKVVDGRAGEVSAGDTCIESWPAQD